MFGRPLHVHLRSVLPLALVAAVAACGNSVLEEPTGGGGAGGGGGSGASGGGGAGASGGGGGGSTSTTGGECPLDLLVCGDQCVDPQTDSQNCGECGVVCPPDVACGGGTCSVPVCYCGAICEWIDLGADVPVSKNIPAKKPSQLDVSCGPGDLMDTAHLFTAPFSATFEIQTISAGSRYVQIMNSTSCDVLLCEAQLDIGPATVTMELAEGQAVLIVIDYLPGQNESVSLTIKEQKGCLPCAEAAWDPSPEKPICDASLPLHDTLTACMCSGACAAPCQSTCEETGGDFTSCYNCMYDTETGCGDELTACLADD